MTSELDRAMDRLLIQFEELKDAQKNARFYAEALTKEDERKSARIRQLEDQLKAAREALEWYGDWAHHYQEGGLDRAGNVVPEVIFDGGSRAREALNTIQRLKELDDGTP